MNITLEQLKRLFPKTSETVLNRYVKPLNELTDQYGIQTRHQVSMFLAQIGHESAGLSITEENLNYTAARLRQVWPRRFPDDATARKFARNPQALANFVYGNRMGNGPEDSGDGWRYRGRGLKQLTGKANYLAFADSLGMTLPQVLDYIETPRGEVESATWFWKRNNLNELAHDVVAATRRINGGLNGLEDRRSLYQRALTIFT